MRIRFALAVTLSLTLCGAAAAGAAIPEPDQDPFYRPPTGFEARDNGAILRSREVSLTLRGVPLPFRAWQLLYRTSDAKDRPEATATIVIAPLGPAAAGRPLVSYQTAEDSLGSQCAPSYTLRAGTEREEVAVAAALLQNWVVAAPDYEGPQSQYGAGHQAGHAVLDGIRAARSFAPVGLAGERTPVGIWGYSGGGLASAWAGALQPDYAPDVNLRGVAAGGVPPDIGAVARQIDGGLFAGILFAAARGLERAYPEMDLQGILNARGKDLIRRIDRACVNDIAAEGRFTRVRDMTTVPDPLVLPRIRRVLEANRLGPDVPSAPTYLYHAILDQLIPIATVDRLVDRWCPAGATLQYHRDLLSEHVALVATGAPAALGYLRDRFEGRPAPNRCPAGGPVPGRLPPTVSLRFAPSGFAATRRSTLRVRVTKYSRLRVTIRRLLPRGRSRQVTTLTRRYLPRGLNTISFSGRIGRRRLAPGRYRATAVATDLGGRRSRPATARFRVIAPH